MGYRAILESFSLEKSVLDQAWVINVYYDVTDPENPLWKFFYNTITDDSGPEEPLGYFVSIHAYTGAIHSCYDR